MPVIAIPIARESKQVPLVVEPGALVMFGPQLAQSGMTIDLQSNGPVRVGLACADTAAPAADASCTIETSRRFRRSPRRS